MASLLASCNIPIMQNTPFNGDGRRPAPHPFLAILPSPKAIHFILIYPLYIECVYVMSCKNMQTFKGKQKYLFKMHRRAGSALCPLPPLRWRSRGGRGEEAGKSCPAWGILSGEGGDLWQVNLAGHVRGWIWRVSMARHFGGSAWRVYLAGQVGSFIWRVFKARGNACC